jgi:tetratricopeptide (TPR) repeat protein
LGYELWSGPQQVTVGISRCEELLRSSRGDRALEAAITRFLAALHAMAGRFDEARDEVDRSSLILDELNHQAMSWVFRDAAAEARELCGDFAGAERELTARWLKVRQNFRRIDMESLKAACELALLYCDDGRWDDADRCLAYGRDLPERIQFGVARTFGLAARARVAAHRGELASALRLARRGVDVADLSDRLNVRARVWLALAEVRRARGETDEAEAAVAHALTLYEQKGNVAAAARLRAPARLAG